MLFSSFPNVFIKLVIPLAFNLNFLIFSNVKYSFIFSFPIDLITFEIFKTEEL